MKDATKLVILAAGEGTRLRPLTDNIPKCMVPLEGKPLVKYQIETAREVGLIDIHVIGGYRHDVIDFDGITKHVNEAYASTNMVSSLFCAQTELNSDVIVGYGDIVPYTVAGKFIATLTALMGVCVVALLTGIVATGFTNQVAMRRQQLEAEISSALSDGVITNDEREKIDDLRQRLNITEEDAMAIIGYLQRKNDQK